MFWRSKHVVFDHIWLSKESNLDCSDARNSASAILGTHQKKRVSGGTSEVMREQLVGVICVELS